MFFQLSECLELTRESKSPDGDPKLQFDYQFTVTTGVIEVSKMVDQLTEHVVKLTPVS